MLLDSAPACLAAFCSGVCSLRICLLSVCSLFICGSFSFFIFGFCGTSAVFPFNLPFFARSRSALSPRIAALRLLPFERLPPSPATTRPLSSTLTCIPLRPPLPSASAFFAPIVIHPPLICASWAIVRFSPRMNMSPALKAAAALIACCAFIGLTSCAPRDGRISGLRGALCDFIIYTV